MMETRLVNCKRKHHLFSQAAVQNQLLKNLTETMENYCFCLGYFFKIAHEVNLSSSSSFLT